MLCHGGIFYYLIIRAELLDKLKPKLKWSYVFGWGKATVIVSSCAENVTNFKCFNECRGMDWIVFKLVEVTVKIQLKFYLDHGAIYNSSNTIIEESKQQFVHLICSFDPGFPALIVAVSLGVTGTKNYAANNCWLSLENGLIYWAFVAPAATVVFVSIHLLSLFSNEAPHSYERKFWQLGGENLFQGSFI